MRNPQEKRQWEKCISFPDCLVGKAVMMFITAYPFISFYIFLIYHQRIIYYSQDLCVGQFGSEKDRSAYSMLTLERHFCYKEVISAICALYLVPRKHTESGTEIKLFCGAGKCQGYETYLAHARWNQYITQESCKRCTELLF